MPSPPQVEGLASEQAKDSPRESTSLRRGGDRAGPTARLWGVGELKEAGSRTSPPLLWSQVSYFLVKTNPH